MAILFYVFWDFSSLMKVFHSFSFLLFSLQSGGLVSKIKKEVIYSV